MPRRLVGPMLALLATIPLAGCGATDSTPPRTGLVLIGGRRADPALLAGARTQARRLGERLTVRGAGGLSVGGQIAAVNAAIAAKPAAVIISPVDAEALFAPTASMQKAGITVVALPASGPGGDAAGAAAVRRAVAAVHPHR